MSRHDLRYIVSLVWLRRKPHQASDADDEAQSRALDEFVASELQGEVGHDSPDIPHDSATSSTSTHPAAEPPPPAPHSISRHSEPRSGVSNEGPDVLTEFVRIDRKREVFREVPKAINEMDTFFYDADGKVIYSDLCRKRDPETQVLRYSTLPRKKRQLWNHVRVIKV